MRLELKYLVFSPIGQLIILLPSPVDVGHIDRTTINSSVLSFLSLLIYIAIYLISLYLSSLTLEAHCYNKLVAELVLFSCGSWDGLGKVQSREIQTGGIASVCEELKCDLSWCNKIC